VTGVEADGAAVPSGVTTACRRCLRRRKGHITVLRCPYWQRCRLLFRHNTLIRYRWQTDRRLLRRRLHAVARRGRGLRRNVPRAGQAVRAGVGRFFRAQPQRRARAYVRGLLAPLVGKKRVDVVRGGDPDGMQRPLNSTCWNTGGVRNGLRGYAVEHLDEPGGVLIIDETGSLRLGDRPSG